jgi:hypothetical protein
LVFVEGVVVNGVVVRELSLSRLLVDIGGSCRRNRSMSSWRAPLLLAVVVVGVVLGWKLVLYSVGLDVVGDFVVGVCQRRRRQWRRCP